MIKSRELTGFLVPHIKSVWIDNNRIDDINNEYAMKMKKDSLEVGLVDYYYNQEANQTSIEYEIKLPITRDNVYFDVHFEIINERGYYEFFLFTGDFEVSENQAHHLLIYLMRSFLYNNIVDGNGFKTVTKKMMREEEITDTLVDIESHDKLIMTPY